MMQKYQADYTNTFRALTFNTPVDTVLFSSTEFAQWHELWQKRLGRQQEPEASSHQLLRRSNPALIPRNHQVEASSNLCRQEILRVRVLHQQKQKRGFMKGLLALYP